MGSNRRNRTTRADGSVKLVTTANPYSLQNTSLPHWAIRIHYENGESHVKEMADDENDKVFHEDIVLDCFLKGYAHNVLKIPGPKYEITGRDGISGQRHDYVVYLEALRETLQIEIVRFGDNDQSHSSNTLRDAVNQLLKRYGDNYFVFLPATTKQSALEPLLVQANELPPIAVPGIENDDAMNTFMQPLKSANQPVIRRTVDGSLQIHTYADKVRQSLRKSLADVISNKEKKNYLPHKQTDMILVIDDKSLSFSRKYIDTSMPLLNYYFRNSTFGKIYLISRKSNGKDNGKNIGSEFMITVIKDFQNESFKSNLNMVEDKLKNNEYFPMEF